MQKFLSIPITATGETRRLVAIDGIMIIQQSVGGITIAYNNADAVADLITLAFGVNTAANDFAARDRFEQSIVSALSTSWQHPSYKVSLSNLVDGAGDPLTITGITLA